MSISIEGTENPSGLKVPIGTEDNMKIDMKEKLLNDFDLLNDENKNQVLDFVKNLIEHSNVKGVKSKAGSPWKDITPLRLNGISLSDIIISDRSENDE